MSLPTYEPPYNETIFRNYNRNVYKILKTKNLVAICTNLYQAFMIAPMKQMALIRSVGLVVFAVVLGLTSALEAKGISLERKFRKSAKVHYLLKLKMTVSMQQQMGMGITADYDSIQNATMKIVSLQKDGPAKIEITFGHIRGKVAIPMFTTMDFDSRAKGDAMQGGGGQMAKFREGLTSSDGKKIAFSMDPKGTVSDVVSEPAAPNTNPAAAAMVVQAFFALLPANEAQTGTTWDDPSLLAIQAWADIKDRAKLSHRLEKFDSKEISIKTEGSYHQEKGEMETPSGQGGGAAAGFRAMGMSYLMNTKIDITATRTATISGRDGLPLSQDFVIEAELESPEMIAGEKSQSRSGWGFGGAGQAWSGKLKLTGNLERSKKRRR